jgi:hypothetical protein
MVKPTRLAVLAGVGIRDACLHPNTNSHSHPLPLMLPGEPTPKRTDLPASGPGQCISPPASPSAYPRPFIRRRTGHRHQVRVRPAPQPTPELLLRKPANEPDMAVQFSSPASHPTTKASVWCSAIRPATKQSKLASKPPPARAEAARPVSRHLQPQGRGGTWCYRMRMGVYREAAVPPVTGWHCCGATRRDRRCVDIA